MSARLDHYFTNLEKSVKKPKEEMASSLLHMEDDSIMGAFLESRANYKLNFMEVPPFYSEFKRGVNFDISQAGLSSLLGD